MKLRRILFWSHLCAGVTAGIVILIMCVTGIALAFERQINDIADRSGRQAVQIGAVRLSVEELLQKSADGNSGLTGVTVYADREQPVALAYGRERNVFIDPYTGKVLGEGSKTSRAFFAAMERWHRALGAELRGRGPGRVVADAANAVFLVLILSGVVLWWPKKWQRSHLRSAALFRSSLAGKAAHWNRHNVIGIWCAAPLFVIVLAGLIMSYTWANNLLYTMTGSQPPASNVLRTEQSARPPIGHRRRIEPDNVQTSLEKLFDGAERQVAGWRSITLRVSNSPNAVFQIDRGNGGQPNKRAQLTLDKASAEVRAWEPFESYSAGRQLRSWARFMHTGEAGGFFGQLIATVVTTGGVLLVWTGLSMAWIRLRQTVSARSARERSTVSQ